MPPAAPCSLQPSGKSPDSQAIAHPFSILFLMLVSGPDPFLNYKQVLLAINYLQSWFSVGFNVIWNTLRNHQERQDHLSTWKWVWGLTERVSNIREIRSLFSRSSQFFPNLLQLPLGSWMTAGSMGDHKRRETIVLWGDLLIYIPSLTCYFQKTVSS